MKNSLEQSDLPLVQKLGHAMSRIQVAMRADSWESFGVSGLNPTQGQILMFLGRRSVALRLNEVADELAVSAPTVSDSIGTLVEKGLVKKNKAQDDGRAIAVSLTTTGKKLVKNLDSLGESLGAAMSQLPHIEQIQLYKTLTRVVRELQSAGKIPMARMCVTCQYFRPNAHGDAERPHHCALVDAAFGDRTLQVDCAEHEPADEYLALQNWETFASAVRG